LTLSLVALEAILNKEKSKKYTENEVMIRFD
jgi:hypothetical protein